MKYNQNIKLKGGNRMRENNDEKKVVEFGYYSSSADIGNHERYLKKIGEFNSIVQPLRVTFLSPKGIATIYYNDQEQILEEGTIIGAGSILRTNGADVELKSCTSETIRLVGKSDLCLENTVEGTVPVIYGNVYYEKGNGSTCSAHIKYRSSCWCKHESPIIVERVNENEDIYYASSKSLTIYEYDEYGEKFDIIKLEPYQKCILSYNINKSMRERYQIKLLEAMKKSDMVKVFERYMYEERWKKDSVYNIKVG